jgi:hypothetical protein
MFLSLGAAFLMFQERIEPALGMLLEMLKVPLQSRWLI